MESASFNEAAFLCFHSQNHYHRAMAGNAVSSAPLGGCGEDPLLAKVLVLPPTCVLSRPSGRSGATISCFISLSYFSPIPFFFCFHLQVLIYDPKSVKITEGITVSLWNELDVI